MPHNTIPVSGGGTGAEDAATARENLEITPQNIGAATTAHTHNPSNLTSAVPVSKGGTGATTAAAARTNLGITRGNLGISYGTSTPSATPATGAGAVYFKII